MKRVILASCFLLSQFGTSQLLKSAGQKIVNDKGENVLLRGLGLGGWMLQEGYMLKTADFAGPQYQIKNKIAELTGEEGMQEFYKKYLENGITKKDIDALKSWGFNSVRLPMHYNLYTLPIEKEKVKGKDTWLEEGFRMTDNLLKWCTENKMYLFLDMHALPGGQGNDVNISDNDKSKPSLWESEENQRKSVALWKKLAERYKDSPWIGGYDIINEPNYGFTGKNLNGCDEESNAPLRKFMVDVTKAIREVDQKHLIIIEGNCWGNNYKGIFPLWDNNLVLSFHKYWNKNDQNSIKQMLEYRNQYNVPIWLGESGENSNVWFTEAISLMENNNIGWAFWPMKKIDNIAGVTNVKITPEYEKLLNYWKNGGEKPSKEFAYKTMMQIADNYKFENTEVKKDVIDAMLRQIKSNEVLSYTSHIIPGRIFATEYDLGRIGAAYYDKDAINYRIDTGEQVNWNSGDKMRNDGVDIYSNKDKVSNGYYVGKIEDGEWLNFTLKSVKPGKYSLEIRYANANGAGQLSVTDGKGQQIAKTELPSTGGDQIWKTIIIKNVNITKETDKIKLQFDKGGFNLNYIEFK
ncbi:cellulase family glycosylhydrolase [Elizabethkingia anophelis]|uniref:cellulase family glycosylhydrolase n=1 Tax=Elizabethkingia anophelis TaxID=1117645 RepID=UPI000C999410|nr:cellulase family glycosylhydrolase [Elizabethkingia anophelis]MCT3760764.1 cellulase family glycosylhydrolase [Elizabethkingia anophelis]MCT3972668.1 cellulase family glycosylhydrolase [Elizabethkingia anophelis]MCT4001142.1 cellulase family glycosylhydrolase [Elizabethkingia anophelis]MCT4014795.1 cellulase family glycosylhydrolase [Elizabethkingia anophelis]MCT4018722.1 cellulase family glycosylhydrolase [Elizabethkingia anophelis]